MLLAPASTTASRGSPIPASPDVADAFALTFSKPAEGDNLGLVWLFESKATKMSDNLTDGWAAEIGVQIPEMADFVKLLAELEKESDRGVVLIMAGFLEQQLKDLLAGYLRDAASTRELLSSPLSTFSARTLVCHAVGLINDDEYHDLKVIRKIRNDFAHKFSASFSKQSIT